MLRIGILGLGEGRSTMSAALASSKLELVKICDLRLELCQQRAKEFGKNAQISLGQKGKLWTD